MRVDVFVKKQNPGQPDGGTWNLYVESVTITNARQMTAAMERDGDHVLLCRNGRRSGLGKYIYETGRQA